MDWSDRLGLYKLPTHTVENFESSITTLLKVEIAKARIEELKLAGQHIQFKDPDYAILRIKALTAEVESNE